jgi:integrase
MFFGPVHPSLLQSAEDKTWSSLYDACRLSHQRTASALRTQNEQRLALGIGRSTPTDLVFPAWDSRPLMPNTLSREWSRTVAAIGERQISLHALRHTHASSLIAAGVDILTVSRRLGHATPTITLGVYGHLYGNTDDRAAQAIDAMLSRTRTE